MRFQSSPRLSFGWAIVSYLLRGRMFNPGAYRPKAGHVVPERFVGVGVAASDDPAVDDYILARLKEAGIWNVRLDFTYGDGERPASRLLKRLCADAFGVTLHFVQPLESARRMEQPDEREKWRDFLAETLDRFGQSVAMVEIGSTINRKRWAGYSLGGFLSMWEIAHQEIRSRGLLLAGPSVTDFEPLFNVGVLSLLRLRNQLPDIHTDNLFSERCTEPERYDHKVFGRFLARFARFNLVKKAVVLEKIGAAAGLPRLLSPAAFWTLPRIERMLPDSEEKQADYLARYMVLCAASGALEGAWWGPFVCHREGLIDEGDFPYPSMERITHYASVRGRVGELRERPALHALAAFNALIPGCGYAGRLSSGDGLEVHAFHAEASVVHVVWTINGRAAVLKDIYADDDLRSASCRNRDGGLMSEQPTLVGESPLYLQWEGKPEVAIKQGAGVLSDVAIHHHINGRAHFFVRENGWRGIVLARDEDEAKLLLEHIHPAQIGRPADDTTLRNARNAIWTIEDPRTAGARLVVKQPVKMHPHKRLLDRFKPSKALRSWNGTCELLRRGVSAASPVAWFERESDPGLMQNYYLCEYVPAEFTARDMVGAFAAGQTSFAGVPEDEAYRQLAAYLLRMHGGGILFRDLSGGNILIHPGAAGKLVFSLIDTGRIRVFQKPLPLGARFADLVRICNKMHLAGRAKFLSIYLGALKLKLQWWQQWRFVAYDFKVAAKRRVGRKAWKQLFSRPGR
ncbi:MAG: hypothetical protein KAX66_02945 [Propionivibrio sp.]|nr:hypothetical protein [Propionivibrio sp.]MBP8214397.1 hypothetical protein [Propionivibrio sp.]